MTGGDERSRCMKPLVFNYADYEALKAENAALKEAHRWIPVSEDKNGKINRS